MRRRSCHITCLPQFSARRASIRQDSRGEGLRAGLAKVSASSTIFTLTSIVEVKWRNLTNQRAKTIKESKGAV